MALVTILGIYELIFFRFIIFKYAAVSVSELDAMVIDELSNTCFINTTTTAAAARFLDGKLA